MFTRELKHDSRFNEQSSKLIELGKFDTDIVSEQLNVHLTPQIYRIIKRRGLTQFEAGAILGIKQPQVSALMRNRSGNFSVERLMDILVALGLAPSIREDCRDCYA